MVSTSVCSQREYANEKQSHLIGTILGGSLLRVAPEVLCGLYMPYALIEAYKSNGRSLSETELAPRLPLDLVQAANVSSTSHN